MGGSISVLALKPAKDDRYLTVEPPYEDNKRVTLDARDTKNPYQMVFLERNDKAFFVRFVENTDHYLRVDERSDGKWVVKIGEYDDSIGDRFRWKAVIIGKRKTDGGTWKSEKKYAMNYGKMKKSSLLVAFLNEASKMVLSFDESGLHLVRVGEGKSEVKKFKNKVFWEAECVDDKYSKKDKLKTGLIATGVGVGVGVGVLTVATAGIAGILFAAGIIGGGAAAGGGAAVAGGVAAAGGAGGGAALIGEGAAFAATEAVVLAAEESFIVEEEVVTEAAAGEVAAAVAENPIAGFELSAEVYGGTDTDGMYRAGVAILGSLSRTL